MVTAAATTVVAIADRSIVAATAATTRATPFATGDTATATVPIGADGIGASAAIRIRTSTAIITAARGSTARRKSAGPSPSSSTACTSTRIGTRISAATGTTIPPTDTSAYADSCKEGDAWHRPYSL